VCKNDKCLTCEYYVHEDAKLTADPYWSEPELNECIMNWDCPYKEDDNES
jgi:hypothetical protein